MYFLRHGRSLRVMLCIVCISFILVFTFLPAEAAGKKTGEGSEPVELGYHLVLDPGHGGNDTGAAGYGRSESIRTLQLAKYIKEELEKYDYITVSLTRTKNTWVNLHDRMKIASKRDADLLVSLHFDSYSQGAAYFDGCSAFVAKAGSYRPEMATAEVRLARSILNELEGLGLNNRGLVRKKSPNVPAYEDGSMGDYSAIIRDGMKLGIPAVLVEHAFIDSWEDYNRVLSSEAKLRKLARADADGIARYLQLPLKDSHEVPEATVRKGVTLAALKDENSYISIYRKRALIEQYNKEISEGEERYESIRRIRFEEMAERLAQEARKKGEILRAYRQEHEGGGGPAFPVAAILLAGLVLYGLAIDTHERYGSGPFFDPAAAHAQLKELGLAFRDLGICFISWIRVMMRIFWIWLCAVGNAVLMFNIVVITAGWRCAKAICQATKSALKDIRSQI